MPYWFWGISHAIGDKDRGLGDGDSSSAGPLGSPPEDPTADDRRSELGHVGAAGQAVAVAVEQVARDVGHARPGHGAEEAVDLEPVPHGLGQRSYGEQGHLRAARLVADGLDRGRDVVDRAEAAVAAGRDELR